MGLENVGKVLAKKKLVEEAGLSPEEAESLVSVIYEKEKKDDGMEQLGKLAQAGEILNSLPPEMRSAMMPAVQQSVMGPPQDDDFLKELQKTMMGLEVIRSYMNTGKNSDEDKNLVEVLLQELRDMKEKAIEAEIQKKDETLQQLAQKFEETQRAIQEFMMRILEQQNTTQPEEKKDIAERVVEDFQQLKKMKELLKELGMIKEGESVDKEQLIEMLRREGYQIQGPPSWEQINRMLEQELKKREEEIRKQVEEELGVKKEKMRMAFDFIMGLVDGVMATARTNNGKKELGRIVDTLKGALKGGGNNTENEQTGE